MHTLTRILSSLTLILIFVLPTFPATRVGASPHPNPNPNAEADPQNIGALPRPSFIPISNQKRALVLDAKLFAREVGHSRFPLKKKTTMLLGDCGAAGPFPNDINPVVTVVCQPGRM
jgi:hypothetical protein